MTKIKIVYLIDTFYKFAGAERNLYDIVKGIDKTMFMPYVFTLKGGGDFALFKAMGVYTRILNVNKVYDFHGLKTMWDLIRFLREEKVDIIVSYHDGADTMAALTGMLAGVKVRISSRRDMGYKLQSRHIKLYRFINRFFTKIITVSDAVAEIISIREKVPKQKFITVYNGVNKEKVESKSSYSAEDLARLGIDRSKILIGVIASFRRIKGIEYFIKAADIVYRANPNVQFLIVGKIPGKPNGYTQELMASAFATAAKSAILFFDFEDNISKTLDILDVVVAPSLSEGFSNTIIESMAAGVPVVATKVGGNVEAIEDGVSGILVTPQDERVVADAILRLIENEGLRKNISSAGQERVKKYFNYGKMIAKTEHIYQALLWQQKHRKRTTLYPIKRFLARSFADILYYTKLLNMIYAVKKKRGSLIILAYHNVVKESDNYLYLDVSADMFQKQVEVMKKYFAIIPLSEAVALLEQGSWQGNYLSITFDDGYKDLYETVFPLVAKESLSMTVFVNTMPIETNSLLWVDRLVAIIRQTRVSSLDLSQSNMGVYLLGCLEEKKQACLQIVSMLKRKRNEEIEKVVSCIEQRCAASPVPKAADVYLSAEEIVLMDKNGVGFGSHAHNHFLLSRLEADELKREVEYSKKCLERIVGHQVTYLAYPNGKTDDFNISVISAVKHAKYTHAFSLLPDQIVVPYSIGRYGIYITDTFHEPLFALRLALYAWEGKRQKNKSV